MSACRLPQRTPSTAQGTPGPGYYFVSFGFCFLVCPESAGYYLALLDTHGVPVWYKSLRRPAFDQKFLGDGTIAFAELGLGPSSFSVMDLNGVLQRRVRTIGIPMDWHDFIELANGNELLMSYPERRGVDLTAIGLGPDETVQDGYLQEIDPSGRPRVGVAKPGAHRRHGEPHAASRPRAPQLVRGAPGRGHPDVGPRGRCVPDRPLHGGGGVEAGRNGPG